MPNTSCTTTGINCHDHEVTRTQKDAEPNAASQGKRYLPASDSTKSGMVCSSPVSLGPVKTVDATDIRFDSREANVDSVGDVVKSSMDAIKNASGPRTQMPGQRDSRNYNENGKTFKSTSNSPDSDTGN